MKTRKPIDDEAVRIALSSEPPKTAFELSLKQLRRDIDDHIIERLMGRPVPSLDEFREQRKPQRVQELLDYVSDKHGLPKLTYVDELRDSGLEAATKELVPRAARTEPRKHAGRRHRPDHEVGTRTDPL